jgi:multidrug efflux system outer membrane protein
MRKPALALVASILATTSLFGQAGGESAAAAPTAFRAVASSTTAGFSSDAPSAAFWTELGDSTLSRLVEQALGGAPDVQAARARVRQSRSAVRLAALDLAPTITSSAGFNRQRLAAGQLPGASVTQRRSEMWDGGVGAEWELDVFGRGRHALRAEQARTGASREDLRLVRLALAAEVAHAYVDLRGAQGQLAVAQRNADNQRRTLALTQERLSAGRGSAFDTERARAQLSSTLAILPLLEARIAASRNRIAALLGREPSALAELDAAAELPPLPSMVRVGSPRELLLGRPDVAGAERRVAAEQQLVSASRADYLPRLAVVGGMGLAATSFDSLGRGGASRYQAGVAVSWPFLNAGRVRSRVDLSRARAEEARAAYRATALRALEEAETALTTYDRARARLGSLADAAQASEHAAQLAQLRFTEGVTDFLPVLDAQRTLLDAQSQLAAARADAASALVEVYRAVGAVSADDEVEGG